DLAITDVQTSRDGTLSVVARGKLDGTLIGLIVDVLPDRNAQRLDRSNAFVYWGKVRYCSLGTESDAFIAALTRLYGLREKPGSMARGIEVKAVSINGDPRSLEKAPVKMKAFFFDEGLQDKYAEVYTNVDLQAKRLEFHEKDPAYRTQLVKALRG